VVWVPGEARGGLGLWNCVVSCPSGHQGYGKQKCLCSVIQAVAEPLDICLEGHTQENLYLHTTIPSFAANDWFVQNFRLAKSLMMEN